MYNVPNKTIANTSFNCYRPSGTSGITKSFAPDIEPLYSSAASFNSSFSSLLISWKMRVIPVYEHEEDDCNIC